MTLTVYTLTAIAVYWYKPKQFSPKSKSILLLVCIWLLALVPTLPMMQFHSVFHVWEVEEEEADDANRRLSPPDEEWPPKPIALCGPQFGQLYWLHEVLSIVVNHAVPLVMHLYVYGRVVHHQLTDRRSVSIDHRKVTM